MDMHHDDPKPAKKLGVFDIDGTVFRWQLYHELVFELKERGIFNPEMAARFDTIFHHWENRSISWYYYEEELFGKFETQLTAIAPADLQQAAQAVLARSSHKTYQYTSRLIQQLKAQGYYLLAITASYQEIAQPFALMHGFDYCIGRENEQQDGQYTGKISRDIYSHKATILTAFANEHRYQLADATAVGDTASDIPMLALVGHPIAFNPNDALLTHAKDAGWDVVVERKNVAYHLEKGANGTYLLADTVTF